jgi:hypothetical protein
MKWYHLLFILLVVALAVFVVCMEIRTDIEVWNSDFPFWLKWKLIFAGRR